MKHLLLIVSAIAICAVALAKGPEAETDLGAALEKAKKEGKILFVQFGRETCGSCQALREMVIAGEVKLPAKTFVYADVNCDDKATSALFRSKFKVSGNTLPFVVIVDPDGNQLAGRTGYGNAIQFKQMIKDAQKKSKTPQK